MKTGKLEKIDTREVWPREDEDFTPWLAKEENLEQLSEAVQMDLSLEEKEQELVHLERILFVVTNLLKM